ncbi:MAG TPA: putative glycolipid-binding domain-containing protein [Candidatus Binataceae bacterium]|nr:putative glycolipid-binding domain-containing protein [Candidatus Binataceae bacterium]
MPIIASATIARWKDWSGKGLEHSVLTQSANRIVAESVVIGTAEAKPFALRYRIVADRWWRVRELDADLIGGRSLKLRSDGRGHWSGQSGRALPKLAGAIDIDISATPFTNTLPIRRLKMNTGDAQEILAVYIQVPALTVITDRQRYTRLDATHYRYDSVDSDFTRKIEIDSAGLVVKYPDLFRRVS